MLRFNQMLIIGTISLLALAGCNSARQASIPDSSTVNSSSSVATAQLTSSQDGFGGLLNVVSNTR